MEKMAILVLSYDGYSDLWKNFFDTFFENWKNCPYRVYLQTNELDFTYPNVTTLKTGKRISWAQAARKVLDDIEEEYLLLLLEDYYLTDSVDNAAIQRHFAYMLQNEIDSLLLKPKGIIKTSNKEYREVSYNQAYCITFGFQIMRKSLFYSLCKENYSPWDFENKNSFEALAKKQLPGKFYSLSSNAFPAWSEGVLVKGFWTRKAYKFFSQRGMQIDLTVHPLMTRGQHAKLVFKSGISRLIPSRLKAKIKKTIQGK